MNKMMGHIFLRKLGKKRLRPGGVKATNFLLSHINFENNLKILEVACNNGLNLSLLSSKYPNCKFYGVDLDKKMIEEANKKNLNNVEFIKANAARLPFDDESIDCILNEAMLTMIPLEIKEKIIKEYNRVLKKGGLLLTHDISIIKNEKKAIEKLNDAVNINVNPLTKKNWDNLFKNSGFEIQSQKLGKLSLMSLKGLITDEGILNTLKLIFNGLKKENRNQFLKMRKIFKSLKNDISYIATVSKKK